MPAVVPDHDGPGRVQVVAPLDLFLGIAHHVFFDKLSFFIQFIQASGQAVGLDDAFGLEQLQPVGGVSHSSGGIDSRRQSIGDVRGLQAFIDACDTTERMYSRSVLRGQDLQSGMHQDAVFMQQGDDIGDCAQRHQVQALLQFTLIAVIAVFSAHLQKCLRHLVCHAYAGKLLGFRRRSGQLGVHHGQGVEFLQVRGVVVGNNQVQSTALCRCRRLMASDAAVNCKQEGAAFFGSARDGLGGQSVAVIDAMRQIAFHPGAVFAQYGGQQRRGGDAVSVIVAVYNNEFPFGDCLPEALRGSPGSGQQIGVADIGQVGVQKVMYLGGINIPGRQNQGNRAAN